MAAWTLATPGRIDRTGTLKGIDFASSWFSGHLAVRGRPDLLYDWSAWRSAFEHMFPDAPGLLFLPNYPPQAALLFSPFGRLPFEQAVIAWSIVSFALYALSLRALWRTCPSLAREGATVAIVAVAWPAFYLLALNAQNTTIILACYTGAWLGYRAGRPWCMGVALGLAAVKPHFLLVPAAVLLFAGCWQAIAGIALAVAVQAAVVLAWFGAGVFPAYLQTALEVARDPTLFEPKLWQAHGLKNALDLLLGRGTLATTMYVVLSLAVVWRVSAMWRRGEGSRGTRFAVLVATSTLLNPHLYGYDLVVLAPAFIIAADWCARHPQTSQAGRLAWLLLALAVVPLVAPLTELTRIQCSVPLLAWFGWTLLTASERPTAHP